MNPAQVCVWCNWRSLHNSTNTTCAAQYHRRKGTRQAMLCIIQLHSVHLFTPMVYEVDSLSRKVSKQAAECIELDHKYHSSHARHGRLPHSRYALTPKPHAGLLDRITGSPLRLPCVRSAPPSALTHGSDHHDSNVHEVGFFVCRLPSQHSRRNSQHQPSTRIGKAQAPSPGQAPRNDCMNAGQAGASEGIAACQQPVPLYV